MAKRKYQSPLPQSKRQKLSDESSSVSASESTHSGYEQDSKPTRKTPILKANKAKKLHVKRPARPKVVRAPSSTDVKTLNSILRCKVQQVLDFHDAKLPSTLDRNEGNSDHATVTISAAIAALMRMRVDYQISDPGLASFGEISDLVVGSFEKRLGSNRSVDFVVLNLSKRCGLEGEIQEKAQGHGLEEIGLFEAELEIHARELEKLAGEGLLRHVQTVYDESDEGTAAFPDGLQELLEEVCKEREVDGAWVEDMGIRDDGKEIGRIGVCPAALIEM